MKITEIKVIISSPGRNFVTVKIMTDEGLYGVGDATVNGRELAVAAYLTEHVRVPVSSRSQFQPFGGGWQTDSAKACEARRDEPLATV